MQLETRLPASRDAEGRHRLPIEAVNDHAIYMLDPDGLVTSWNPGAQRLQGYAAGEVVGETFARFYPDEERAAGAPEQALRRAAAEGLFEREGWQLRKDGGRFWAHLVLEAVHTPAGDLAGYAAIARDLTEHRLAEDERRRTEAEFRMLVQGVTDYAIYMLDRDGRVISWNAGAERIKGYRAEEIIGEHFSRFYTEADRAAGVPARGLATALREGRWEHEGLRVRKDGAEFWAHVVIDPIRSESGEVVGFAKITRDVTERRETQRALDEAREALFQAQKMEAIGQLTGGVAHDFNNLLMAVLGSLELVRKRLPYDPRISPLIENAILGAERGARLTQRMLAFARKQELKLECVDLSALVEGMQTFLKRTIGPEISIEARLPPGLKPVRTDPAQLETALLNLAVNARDAMPEGGVITVSARAQTVVAPGGALAPGDYVGLTVTDTGEGMDEETLARATEPFFTTKGVGRGTGLGLSMVYGLAAQSGGGLSIESRVDEGTSVTLWLPAVEAEADDAPRRATAAAAAPGGTRELTILAVDDDRLVLTNTAALLEDLGHRVFTAASGDEALEIIERTPDLDLVVTDQAMPRMSGLQLRDAALRVRPGLPVLIATGYAEMPPGADSAVARIAKPFTQDELAARVQECAGPQA